MMHPDDFTACVRDADADVVQVFACRDEELQHESASATRTVGVLEDQLNSTKLAATQSASKLTLLEIALVAQQVKCQAESERCNKVSEDLQVRHLLAS